MRRGPLEVQCERASRTSLPVFTIDFATDDVRLNQVSFEGISMRQDEFLACCRPLHSVSVVMERGGTDAASKSCGMMKDAGKVAAKLSVSYVPQKAHDAGKRKEVEQLRFLGFGSSGKMMAASSGVRTCVFVFHAPWHLISMGTVGRDYHVHLLGRVHARTPGDHSARLFRHLVRWCAAWFVSPCRHLCSVKMRELCLEALQNALVMNGLVANHCVEHIP